MESGFYKSRIFFEFYILTSARARYNIDMGEVQPIKVKSWHEYIHEHPSFTGCLIDDNGDMAWYLNGKMHREDGPAIESPVGSKAWYKNGLRHRENGPAIEYGYGAREWWLNGKQYEEKKHRIAVRQLKMKLLDTDQHSL
jgi:hypothetical protein